jgi:hypothetical protein
MASWPASSIALLNCCRRNSTALISPWIYALAPRREIGENAPFLAGFHRLELPVLDERDESRWPERFPRERLDSIRRRTGPARFAAQMLLQPTSTEDARLDPGRIPLYDGELEVEYLSGERMLLQIEGRRMISVSCWWDPAFGTPRNGDGSVIAAVFGDADGGYWLHRIRWLEQDARSSSDAASQLCAEAAKFARDLHLPAIRLETNGIGKFLPGLLRRALVQAECGAGVIECTSRKSKSARILEAFDVVLAAGALQAHRSVALTPFFAEMREWRPDGRCRDDGLDAVSGCLLSEPVRFGLMPVRPALPDWRGLAAQHQAQTDFDL